MRCLSLSRPRASASSKAPRLNLLVLLVYDIAEHQDPLWAHTAHKECYPGILEVLVATQNGYPARA